jgi:hypothetical protein
MIKLGLCATAYLMTTFDGFVGDLAAKPRVTPPASDTDDGAWLRRDLFEAHIGENFSVQTPTGKLTLKLTAVEDVLSARNAGKVNDPNCFTVVFRAPKGASLAQGSYRVDSSSLGTFTLFIVPEARRQNGLTYVATFNRL